MKHGYDVRLTWITSKELTVEYPDKADLGVKRERLPVTSGSELDTVQAKYIAVPSVRQYSLEGGSKCGTTR
jgi:hypothetical protein